MCGIVGIFSRGEPVSAGQLQRATRSLFHRGPDGQRHWTSPDRRVGLGHARLSIIDLATGSQPIASEDGRSQIVVNGEFYGYEAIQRELERSGHRLRTRSDSEIALHLYEDLGPQCLHHLRGEFAFIIWDESHRTLFAARDKVAVPRLRRSVSFELPALVGEDWIIQHEFLTIDLAPFVRGAVERLGELVRARTLVHTSPDILGGTPVIRGTRIPVYDVAASAAAGISTERILAAYPGLDAEKIELAAIFAQAYPPRGRPRAASGELPAGAVIVSDHRRPRRKKAK